MFTNVGYCRAGGFGECYVVDVDTILADMLEYMYPKV